MWGTRKRIILLGVSILLISVFLILYLSLFSNTTLTPREEQEVYETVQNKRLTYEEQVQSLPFNAELIGAIRANQSFGDVVLARPFPIYDNLTDEEVVGTFRDYTLSFWEEGFESAGADSDLNISVRLWLHSLSYLAMWGQSPYISEESLLAWQDAYKEGKETIENLVLVIKDAEARREMEDYLSFYFDQDHFRLFESGLVNSDIPLIGGVDPIRD